MADVPETEMTLTELNRLWQAFTEGKARCGIDTEYSIDLANGECIIQGLALGWTRREDQPGGWVEFDTLEDPPVPTGRTLNVGEPTTL